MIQKFFSQSSREIKRLEVKNTILFYYYYFICFNFNIIYAIYNICLYFIDYQGVSRSPMYSLFTEMLLGLSTIRAYAKESEFLSRHFKISDYNGKIYFMFWMARLTAILFISNKFLFLFIYFSLVVGWLLG